jgi:hypothetical protein
VPPYQQGSSGTGSVSVGMQQIWAFSGTEGVVQGMNMIKTLSGTKCVSPSTQLIKGSSDTEGFAQCLQVIMALIHSFVFVIFDRKWLLHCICTVIHLLYICYKRHFYLCAYVEVNGCNVMWP